MRSIFSSDLQDTNNTVRSFFDVKNKDIWKPGYFNEHGALINEQPYSNYYSPILPGEMFDDDYCYIKNTNLDRTQFAILYYSKDGAFINRVGYFTDISTYNIDTTKDIRIIVASLNKTPVMTLEDILANISIRTNITLKNMYSICNTYDIYNFEFGGVNRNTGLPVENKIRLTTGFIDFYNGVLNKTIYIKLLNYPNDYMYSGIIGYDENYNYVKLLGGFSTIGGYDGFLSSTLNNDDIDNKICYIKVSIKHSDEHEFTDDEVNDIKLVYLYNNLYTHQDHLLHKNYMNNALQSLNWFKGKKYAALGDSITYGYIPRNYDGYPGQLNSYAKLTAEKLGMEFSNFGISGSSLAYISTRNPMCRRWDQLPDDADLITVMGGSNDIRNNISLGTMNDRTDATYYGALHVIFSGLIQKYYINQGVEIGKNKKIVAITPIKLLYESGKIDGGTGILYDLEPWVNAVKEVSAYYSIPCLDFYNNSGINPHLNQTIKGTVTGYTDWYNPYITDGAHPTQEAAEIMSDLLVGFLKGLA